MPREAKTDTSHLGNAQKCNGWQPRARKARAVGDFIPKLLQPAFEKYGFPAAAILTDWAAIVGRDMAAYTAPERLKWPRRNHSGDDIAAEGSAGATLVLRVSGARALDVDHMRPRIIERINSSFGYRAVGGIKLIQAPIARTSPAAKIHGSKPLAQDDIALADVPESPLKNALARISSGLKARQNEAKVSER